MEREDIMDLDLNFEPLDQPQYSWHGVESILNELETAQGRIEERIRQLEAVTSRARERRRQHQTHISPSTIDVASIQPASDVARSSTMLYSVDDPSVVQESPIESVKGNKRNCTELIAKALATDPNESIGGLRSGDFYDCNICLEMAMEPILTCCGHLFCWPCFYHLPYEHSNVKECPVCAGEVVESALVPIYGSGDSNYSRKSKESGLEFPPRPRAKRSESKRQCRINRGLPLPPRIEERIQLLTNIVGSVEDRTSSVLNQYENEPLSSQQRDAVDFSRQLVQGSASFSSLTSALDSAERLVDDLETYGNSFPWRITRQQSQNVDNAVASSVLADISQVESQTSDTAAVSSSSEIPSNMAVIINDVPAFSGGENQTTDTEETNATELWSSSRRASGAPRVGRGFRRIWFS
ncbi:uncharacterized protein LOC133782274 [Humulus lupulus]|uniref:uncharacterized protein LOC133782274 n=1 Tax=Humulus lupulus TaxID=3486 RepID=UPI002B400928|nr:uncharacterized protein LOC133782274 [Humulus lupulus]XP_062077508.1 uncharacterized protein LOC133782274 [Humulus lupulus]